MVLRQLRTSSADEHAQNVMDSVRQAKLAVQMDVRDGRSWCEFAVLFVATPKGEKGSKEERHGRGLANSVLRLSTDVLGNAYLSLFFNSGQNPKISQQALSAYAQAVGAGTGSGRGCGLGRREWWAQLDACL